MTRRMKILLLTSFLLIAVALLIAIKYGVPLMMSDSSRREVGQQRVSEGQLSVVGSDLNSPWSVVFYGNTPLVSSRNTGQIFEINKDGSTRLVGSVEGAVHRGEGGLLGLAIHDSYLYAYYTTDSDNRISRFMISKQTGQLLVGRPELIVDSLPSATTHNGGRIDFGPDGMLYVTVGDAGDRDSAQDLGSLGGKILRMTPEGDIPDDNPFSDSLIYSYGHRNPQGIAWDSDGVMYSTEFGQNVWDELNIIRPGANYGWPEVEGNADCQQGQDCLYVDPVQQWETSKASPSGMAIAEGVIYIANLRGSVLRAVPLDNLSDSKDYFKGEYGRIRDVVATPAGELWFVTNNTDGRGIPATDDDRIMAVPLSMIAN